MVSIDESFEEIGDIHFRDKWQFELKSEFFPLSHSKNSSQVQEFYFFIPNSFQINDQTYSTKDFYRDQTNLIRFKTPSLSFKEILDTKNKNSPLYRIRAYIESEKFVPERVIFEEIKLFGNIFRSSFREKILELLKNLEDSDTPVKEESLIQEFDRTVKEAKLARASFLALEYESVVAWDKPLLEKHFIYIEEFLSLLFVEYFTYFLKQVRLQERKGLAELDKKICDILIEEEENQAKEYAEPVKIEKDSVEMEYILYRNGLLNKFVLDPLLLKTSRASVDQKYRNWIGSIAAGIAMMLYMALFVWQGSVFLWNSEPFILMTVIIYVLKDRLKEELKSLSHRKAAQWFSDYTTEIATPFNNRVLGSLQESMSFIDEQTVPEEISKIRRREFHTVLETIKRPERIIYYKKTINIKKVLKKIDSRFSGLNIIFRFDIHHFLAKVEDPYHTYLKLNSLDKKLMRIRAPKVYHLNIIMKTTNILDGGAKAVELKKYRLILDKSGIKRVEIV